MSTVHTWTTLACQDKDCDTSLGRYDAFTTAGAFLSCKNCQAVYRIVRDSLGTGIEFVAAPCGYCGALTEHGGPCSPCCGLDATNTVNLEER
jgi:predicted Zn finger-like uncharacterized protein